MKKIFSFVMMFAVAATAFVACSKEEVIETPNAPVLSGKTKTITVTSATTRTTIEDKQLKWAEDDTYGILFANAEGKIIGSTESPEYSAETETYTLEAPEETAALYCYYPYNAVSESEAESAVSTGATSVKYGIVDLNIYDGEQEGGQYTYMAANAEVSEENTVNVKFELLAAILELNIYDSSEETPDHSALYNVAIFADKSAGWATLSFADGVKLHTEESDELSTYIRANFNSMNGEEVNVGTKDEPVKVYVPVLKGSYENFDVVVTTENHSFGTIDNRLVISKGEISIEQDYYTVKVDLAEGEISNVGGGDETGVGHDFENAEVNKSAGVGDANAVINSFEKINYPHPGYSMTWTNSNSCYALDITGSADADTDMAVIQLDKWWTNITQAFGDSDGKTPSSTLFAGGTITVYGYGESWLCFYDATDEDKENPIAYIYINFHSGKEENSDVMFALASEYQKAGILLRPTTNEDDWYVNDYGATEQWVLIVTTGENTISFDRFPNAGAGATPMVLEDQDKEYGYFNITSGTGEEGTPATVTLTTDEKATYNVIFYDASRWHEAYVRLHVIFDADYDLGDEGGNGEDEGDEPAAPTFALSSDNDEDATLKQVTGDESWVDYIKTYNSYGADLKEFWELTVKGSGWSSPYIKFSSIPKWEDSGELELEFFDSNGSSWEPNFTNSNEYWDGSWFADRDVTVGVVGYGDAYWAGKADFIVVFKELDREWGVPAYALHVIYTE